MRSVEVASGGGAAPPTSSCARLSTPSASSSGPSTSSSMRLRTARVAASTERVAEQRLFERDIDGRRREQLELERGQRRVDHLAQPLLRRLLPLFAQADERARDAEQARVEGVELRHGSAGLALEEEPAQVELTLELLGRGDRGDGGLDRRGDGLAGRGLA